MSSLVDFYGLLSFYDTMILLLFIYFILLHLIFFPGSPFIQDCKKEIRKNRKNVKL